MGLIIAHGAPKGRLSQCRPPRPSAIPNGSWPRRMPASLAAGYYGESTVDGFLKRSERNTLYPGLSRGAACEMTSQAKAQGSLQSFFFTESCRGRGKGYCINSRAA